MHKWIANRVIDKVRVMENLRAIFFFRIVYARERTRIMYPIQRAKYQKKTPVRTKLWRWCVVLSSFFFVYNIFFIRMRHTHFDVRFMSKTLNIFIEIMKMWQDYASQ